MLSIASTLLAHWVLTVQPMVRGWQTLVRSNAVKLKVCLICFGPELKGNKWYNSIVTKKRIYSTRPILTQTACAFTIIVYILVCLHTCSQTTHATSARLRRNEPTRRKLEGWQKCILNSGSDLTKHLNHQSSSLLNRQINSEFWKLSSDTFKKETDVKLLSPQISSARDLLTQ